MTRYRRLSLCATLLVVVFAATALLGGTAEARRHHHRRHHHRRHRIHRISGRLNAKAAAGLMGRFKFGMTKTDVLKVIARRIRKRYAKKIAATTEVYRQDTLRRERENAIKRIKNTYIAFGSKKTGWDVSIIDDQFAHNTGESMMMHWESSAAGGRNQRRFFFFHNGHLYKMFIALNPKMLPQSKRTFAFFKTVVEQQYGPGKVIKLTDPEHDATTTAIDWRSSRYHLRAIDKTDFYGTFCLYIADPDTEREVARERARHVKPVVKNNIIQSVLDNGKDDGDLTTANSNVVDSIVGKGKK